MQLKTRSNYNNDIKAVLSHTAQFQKGFMVLTCLIGLLLALIPHVAPASSGSELEWKSVLPGGHIQDSSATLADIDGDGKDEIIVGTTSTNPILVVLEDNGAIKWSRALPHGMGSTPTVVDISHPADNIPEIIVTTGVDIPSFSAPGAVIAFDRNGNQLWRYNTNDAQGTGTPFGNFGSVVAGDVDNDGDMELAFGSWDRNIYLLDHQGHKIWHYHNADTIWSTPVLVDLDGNQTLEIVFSTDIAGGGILPDGYRPTDGGFMLILNNNGQLLARRQMNEAIYSSPVVVDANNDGVYEIFVGTGMFYYKEGNYSQPYINGFRIDMSGPPDEFGIPWRLEDLLGWPQPVAYPGMSSPAIADLDNDGDLEVIIGTGDLGGGSTACSNNRSDPDCTGALYAWHHTGDLVAGFPMWPKELNGKNWPLRSSPTVGDVDGDGELEIAIAMGWEVPIISRYGVQELSLHTDCTVIASPSIGDPDNDGQTNIIIGGCDAFNNTNKGHLYNFEFIGNTFNRRSLAWPQFHADAQNSGLYTKPPIANPQLPTSVSILHELGNDATAIRTLRFSNLGGAPFNFEITNLPNRVQLSSTSGQVPAYGELSLTMTVNTADLGERTHQLGALEVYDSDTDTFSGDISVNVIVGELNHVYLPITRR